jgi:hypothetical protein
MHAVPVHNLQAKKRADSWVAVSKQLRTNSSSCRDTASSTDQRRSGTDQRRSQALKPHVRRGIPFEMRPTQWFQLSGAAARQAAAGGGYYSKLSGINGLPVNMLLQVSEDLSPGIFQFRTHPLFKKQDGMDAVRRILCAYVQHNPEGAQRATEVAAAYCQTSACRVEHAYNSWQFLNCSRLLNLLVPGQPLLRADTTCTLYMLIMEFAARATMLMSCCTETHSAIAC